MLWIELALVLFGFFVLAFGFVMLGLAIRDLARKVESITKLPPERIKYVIVYEKESEPLGLEER